MENVGEMKMDKRDYTEQTPKFPTLPTTIVPLTTSRRELRTPVRTDKRSNRLYAEPERDYITLIQMKKLIEMSIEPHEICVTG